VLVAGDLSRLPARHNPIRHLLGVRLPSGWWTCSLGTEAPVGEAVTSRLVKPASVEDRLPGGGAEIAVEVESTTAEDYRQGGDRRQVDTRKLYLCGVGRSRAPSCTSLEVYRFAGELAGSRDTPATFLEDGTILLSGSTDGNSGVEQRYRVVFP
jgi:hypothetical protein